MRYIGGAVGHTLGHTYIISLPVEEQPDIYNEDLGRDGDEAEVASAALLTEQGLLAEDDVDPLALQDAGADVDDGLARRIDVSLAGGEDEGASDWAYGE
jgi:hypothetical protein